MFDGIWCYHQNNFNDKRKESIDQSRSRIIVQHYFLFDFHFVFCAHGFHRRTNGLHYREKRTNIQVIIYYNIPNNSPGLRRLERGFVPRPINVVLQQAPCNKRMQLHVGHSSIFFLYIFKSKNEMSIFMYFVIILKYLSKSQYITTLLGNIIDYSHYSPSFKFFIISMKYISMRLQ